VRRLRGELRKLVRPLVLGALVGFAVVVAISAAVGQEAAAGYTAQVQAHATVIDTWCAKHPTRPQLCQEQRQLFANNVEYLHEVVDPVAISQTPVGAIGFSGALVSTGAGLFVMLLVAGGHVGGEWSGGTITSVLSQDGRRGAFLATKVLSLVLLGWLLLLAGAVSAVAVGQLGRVVWHELPAVTGVQIADYASVALLALPVLGFFACFAMLMAVLARSPLGTLGLGIAIAVPWTALVRVESLEVISIGYWVGELLDIGRYEFLRDHVWPDPFTGTAPVLAFLGLLLGSLTCLFLARWRLQRMDVP